MTPSKFLKELLDSQKLTQDQLDELDEHRTEVETILREKFGSNPLIRPAGSKAKGTMIKESYDLDITCYFANNDERTIEEIYKDVADTLGEEFSILLKTSAIRIHKKSEEGVGEDYHIDVVPGKFLDKSEEDAFLHLNSNEGERLKTNIYKHIAAIRDSKAQETIKLIKLWNVRNGCGIKTFVLELIVVRALEKSESEDIEDRLIMTLEYLRDKIPSIRLEDPANSNNVISDTISKEEKTRISKDAGKVLEEIDQAKEEGDEEDVVMIWNNVFQERSTAKRNHFYPSTTGVVVSMDPIKDREAIKPNRPWRS